MDSAISSARLKAVALDLRVRESLEQSMRLAQARQLRMLPKVPDLAGFEIGMRFLPCNNVSGDFYDIIKLDDSRVGLAMGDVSGHGIEAGIVMGMAKMALKMNAKTGLGPKQTLIATNAELLEDLDGQTFVSAAYGVLNVDNRSFTFSRAGNNPPLLVNPARTPQVQELRPLGLAIGMDKKGKQFGMILQEQVIQLMQGDLLFQFTDGLVECIDSKRTQLGVARVKELLLKFYFQPLEELLNSMEIAIKSHRDEHPQDDDITLLAVSVFK